jgi:hypothetical protein
MKDNPSWKPVYAPIIHAQKLIDWHGSAIEAAYKVKHILEGPMGKEMCKQNRQHMREVFGLLSQIHKANEGTPKETTDSFWVSLPSVIFAPQNDTIIASGLDLRQVSPNSGHSRRLSRKQ